MALQPTRHTLEQVGALPVRLHAEGFVEVMLVTSSESRRWVIPKGWAPPGLEPQDAVAILARNEVGLIGGADPQPCGQFIYDKRLSSGAVLPCRVTVHLFRVAGQLERWPGRVARECVWLTSREAARQVCNLSLQRLIARAGRSSELLRPSSNRSPSAQGRIDGATPKLA